MSNNGTMGQRAKTYAKIAAVVGPGKALDIYNAVGLITLIIVLIAWASA